MSPKIFVDRLVFKLYPLLPSRKHIYILAVNFLGVRERLHVLVLLEVCDRIELLLDARRLAEILGVSERQARNYREALIREGLVILVVDKRGRRVMLTEEARRLLEEYRDRITRALKEC